MHYRVGKRKARFAKQCPLQEEGEYQPHSGDITLKERQLEASVRHVLEETAYRQTNLAREVPSIVCKICTWIREFSDARTRQEHVLGGASGRTSTRTPPLRF